MTSDIRYPEAFISHAASYVGRSHKKVAGQSALACYELPLRFGFPKQSLNRYQVALRLLLVGRNLSRLGMTS